MPSPSSLVLLRDRLRDDPTTTHLSELFITFLEIEYGVTDNTSGNSPGPSARLESFREYLGRELSEVLSAPTFICPLSHSFVFHGDSASVFNDEGGRYNPFFLRMDADYIPCVDCDVFVPSEDCQTAYDGDRILCPTCYARSYSYCAGQGLVIHVDDEGCEEEGCGRCRPREVPVPRRVREVLEGYLANPIDILGEDRSFKKLIHEKGDTLFMGVELEVHPKVDAMKALDFAKSTLGEFAIMKHDGSLREGGFEIVTVPASLGSHRENWVRFLTDAHKFVLGWDQPQCGMHVHLDASYVGRLTYGKMLNFINKDRNLAETTGLAGRPSNSYSVIKYRRVQDANIFLDHHQALAPGHNKPTFELRIFRSNVSPRGFFRNLEFSHAIVHFCRDSGHMFGLDWWSFADWFNTPDNRSTYPCLRDWLIHRGLLTPHATKPRVPPAFEEKDFL